MKKFKLIFFFLVLALAQESGSVFGQCLCLDGAFSSLEIRNLVTGNISMNPGGVVAIPYSALTSNSTVTIFSSPHPTNSLNTGRWATKLTVTLNNSPVIPGISAANPYMHMSGANSSWITFPASDLIVGTNKVCISAICGGSLICIDFCYTINVEQPSGSITLTPECCTTTGYPGSNYTGLLQFRMAGTMTHALIKAVQNGNITMVPFKNNDYTPCFSSPVTFTIVDINAPNNPVPNATINGNSYNSSLGCNYKYVKNFRACLNVKNYGTTISYSSHTFSLRFRIGLTDPKVVVQAFGNIANTGVSYSLGSEIRILPKGKRNTVIPAIDLEAAYGSFNVRNALQRTREKYPVKDIDSSVKSFSETPKKASTFGIGIGPKVIFLLNRFTIGTGVLVGYQRSSQPSLKIIDEKLSYPAVFGVAYNSFPLIYQNLKSTNRGGLFILPKLELSYWITNSIAFSADISYNIGRKSETEIQTLQATDANGDKFYTRNELLSGTLVTTSVVNRMNFMSSSIGLKIVIRKSKPNVGL